MLNRKRFFLFVLLSLFVILTPLISQDNYVKKRLRRLDLMAILRKYAINFAYANATTPDFINVCESVYGEDLDWFFDPDEWILSKRENFLKKVNSRR